MGFPGARRGPAPAGPLWAPPRHRLRPRRAPGRQALPRAVAGLRLGLAPGAATAAGGGGVGGRRSGFWEFTIFPFSETRMFPYNGPDPCSRHPLLFLQPHPAFAGSERAQLSGLCPLVIAVSPIDVRRVCQLFVFRQARKRGKISMPIKRESVDIFMQ